MEKHKKELSYVYTKALAVHFAGELEENDYGSTIKIDSHKAKGFISSYRIFGGLTIWVYNLTFHSDFKVDLVPSENPYYYFCYNVKGYFEHRFGDEKEYTKILQSQNLILKNSPGTSAVIKYPVGIKIEQVIIVVDVKRLESQDSNNAKRIYNEVGKIFRNIEDKAPHRYVGGIDIETEKQASIVCENNIADAVGGLLTEGAVLNMFALQIKAYYNDISQNGTESTLSKTELSKITSLKDYIIDNFQTGLTILTLSRHFGLSPKKLQIGVKHLYGDTVGDYILNLRMSHAKHLFDTTDFNVSEIQNLVGISSGSHFSKVFKKRYKVLPSHYRT